MLKVIILEDEIKAANMLKDCISMVAPDCTIIGLASNLKEGKELMANNDIDLAFFDIELPDGHSFDLLAELPEINFGIVFTTAHSKYAVNAFQYSAIDFVIKPITPDAIGNAIEKAKKSLYFEQMSEKISNLIENRNRSDEEKKIILQCADSIHFATIKDIVRCQAENNYTHIILNSGEDILVSKPLKEYEDLLSSKIFFRSHQSHMVNLSYITQIKKRTYQIVLKNGDIIQLATRKKDQLIETMKRRLH